MLQGRTDAKPHSNDAVTVAVGDTAHRLQQGVLYFHNVIAVPLTPTTTIRPSVHRLFTKLKPTEQLLSTSPAPSSVLIG